MLDSRLQAARPLKDLFAGTFLSKSKVRKIGLIIDTHYDQQTNREIPSRFMTMMFSQQPAQSKFRLRGAGNKNNLYVTNLPRECLKSSVVVTDFLLQFSFDWF